MAATQARAPTGCGEGCTPPRVGVTPLVVAVEGIPLRDLGAVLRMALRPWPVQVVLDLKRAGVVVTPQAGPARTVVVPTGHLATATLPLLLAVLEAAFRSRPPRVVIDLRHLTSIDGAGTSALAAAAERMRGWGGTLSVRDPYPGVRRVASGRRAAPLPVAVARSVAVPA